MPGSLLPRLGGVAAIVGGALNLARYTRDRAFSFGRTTTRPRPPAPCPRAFRTGTDPAATVTTGRSLSIVMSFPCRRWELRRTVTGLRGKRSGPRTCGPRCSRADRASTGRSGINSSSRPVGRRSRPTDVTHHPGCTGENRMNSAGQQYAGLSSVGSRPCGGQGRVLLAGVRSAGSSYLFCYPACRSIVGASQGVAVEPPPLGPSIQTTAMQGC